MSDQDEFRHEDDHDIPGNKIGVSFGPLTILLIVLLIVLIALIYFAY